MLVSLFKLLSRISLFLQVVHVHPQNLDYPFSLNLTPWNLQQGFYLPISFLMHNDYSIKISDRGKQTVERYHLYCFEHYEHLVEDKVISIDTATLKVFFLIIVTHNPQQCSSLH